MSIAITSSSLIFLIGRQKEKFPEINDLIETIKHLPPSEVKKDLTEMVLPLLTRPNGKIMNLGGDKIPFIRTRLTENSSNIPAVTGYTILEGPNTLTGEYDELIKETPIEFWYPDELLPSNKSNLQTSRFPQGHRITEPQADITIFTPSRNRETSNQKDEYDKLTEFVLWDCRRMQIA